jgi:hypothetical protein
MCHTFKEVAGNPDIDTMDVLCAKALQWVGGKGFDDDVCLLACKFN